MTKLFDTTRARAKTENGTMTYPITATGGEYAVGFGLISG